MYSVDYRHFSQLKGGARPPLFLASFQSGRGRRRWPSESRAAEVGVPGHGLRGKELLASQYDKLHDELLGELLFSVGVPVVICDPVHEILDRSVPVQPGFVESGSFAGCTSFRAEKLLVYLTFAECSVVDVPLITHFDKTKGVSCCRQWAFPHPRVGSWVFFGASTLFQHVGIRQSWFGFDWPHAVFCYGMGWINVYKQ